MFYSEKFGILEKKWQKPEMKIATEFDSITGTMNTKKQGINKHVDIGPAYKSLLSDRQKLF